MIKGSRGCGIKVRWKRYIDSLTPLTSHDEMKAIRKVHETKMVVHVFLFNQPVLFVFLLGSLSGRPCASTENCGILF